MEVILREDVQSLGKAGELVRVKPGYARNFLLPKGLAYEATEGNKKRIAAEGRARQARHATERTEAEQLASRLGALTIALVAKAGEGERLFGSITSQDIADAVLAQGIELDKRKIELEHPIKTLGTHTVPVRLHADVQAELAVTVTAE
ncbi:MAG: 50S ribosomal protein L9 [Gemmatimonadota bacterium]|nr:50S ribosomal protein L9 [Gemmatimonadota bacterium]